jgi:hypothetical protein
MIIIFAGFFFLLYIYEIQNRYCFFLSVSHSTLSIIFQPVLTQAVTLLLSIVIINSPMMICKEFQFLYRTKIIPFSQLQCQNSSILVGRENDATKSNQICMNSTRNMSLEYYSFLRTVYLLI